MAGHLSNLIMENSPMDDERFLSEHFTWEEAVITSHREIENSIHDPAIHEAILKTASKMEKVRALFGNLPITINSWYRCPALNTAVGGAINSDHMFGRAVDFILPAYGNPTEVAKKIAHDALLIGFKQLILEHSWVHISWDLIPGTQPKLEVLSLLSGGGYAKGLTDKLGKSIA